MAGSQQSIYSIDDLVALIASCDLAGVRESLIPALNHYAKISGRARKLEDLLVEPTSDGRDPLDVLPAPYGYGYLLILVARLHVPNFDVSAMLDRVTAFAENCVAEELRVDALRVFMLAEWTRSESHKLGQVHRAVQPLINLFDALRRTLPRHVLTPLHRTLAYTCLQAQAYTIAAERLQDPVWDFEPQFGITYQDHLLYHYYIGIIFATVSQFWRAIEALETVVASPGSATAAVQIDAYKKLVLVSYLGRGKRARIPKYTSLALQNHFKNTFGEPYLNLVDALIASSIERASAVAQKHADTFNADGNWGLVERALERIRPQIVQKLTETYVALSLEEVARHIGLEEPHSPQAQQDARRLIRAMIDRREIFAEIQPDATGNGATVLFLTDPEPYNSMETAKMIDVRSQMASYMGELARRRAQELGASKEFLQKAIQQAGQAPSAAGFAGMMGEEEGLDLGPGLTRGGHDDVFGNFDD